MGNFTQSIRRVFENAGKSFVTFPAVMVNALLFTLVSIVRTAMDWQDQLPYNFLFNSLQSALALGAIFSLAAITYAHSRLNTKKAFTAANLLGLVVPAAAFLLLYYFGGAMAESYYPGEVVYMAMTGIASARVGVAIFLSLLAFLLLAGKTEQGLDFSGAVFMTLKAFFLALIYGLVIMGGASGVFAAIKALLYTGLTTKVFGYVGAISAFIGFSIFVGYFPDFHKGAQDEHRAAAQKQPRFITVLFEFILVPIMLALTVVLVLWAGRTILGGMNTRFLSLYGIAASYAIGGLLLHILVTHNDSKLANFYKKVFPFAVLFILLFEAWALVIQLNKYGMKTTEYVFIVIWLVAFISAVLLILKKDKAHPWIVYVTSALAVIAVLPFIGFNELPYNQQVGRLERLLTAENMLQGDKIVPAATEPSLSTREGITDAVDFLIYQENNPPAWLDKTSLKMDSFRTTFGFDRVFPDQGPDVNGEYQFTMLNLPPMAIDVSGYQWELTSLQAAEKYLDTIRFTGKKGEYAISWNSNQSSGLPVIEIKLNGQSIVKDDLKAYMDKVQQKYPLGNQEIPSASLEDMTHRIEVPEISLILIFNRIEINSNSNMGEIYYGVSPQAIYLNEK